MKIEYSIFNPTVNQLPASLTFKLILNSDDWVLLNLFESSKFKSIICRNSDNFSNLDDSTLNPDRNKYIMPNFPLVCSWGKDHVTEGVDNNGNTIWVTNEFKLESESMDDKHFKTLLDEFKEKISQTMKNALNEVGKETFNCWKKTETISYRKKELRMEII